MEEINTKKQSSNIVFLFFAMYMVSYITRINYGTVISAIEAESGISRSLLSMSVTGSFITYGIGQIISGICGDKFSPKKLILYGLVVTCLMNIIIPMCHNPYQMLIIWCINGFAQSFMWPPLVRIMVALLDEEEYKKACTKVVCGSSIGTVILYLLSPFIIAFSGWKAVFGFSAMCGIVMIVFWGRFCPNVKIQYNHNRCRKKPSTDTSIFYAPTFMVVMVAIILQGMLRDGVTTWMPSYMSDVYNVSSVVSILTGVILPLFSVVCLTLAARLYVYRFKNPVICSAVFFLVAAISALAIKFFSGKTAILSVLSFAILTGSMYGANLMLTSMLPQFFSKTGNVSTISGVLNACTYVGSALSTYGIAVLSENKGWDFTVLLWVMIAALGTVICFISAKPLIRKILNE